MHWTFTAQKLKYEIAGYGTACTWAKLLDYDDALELLKKTIVEEKEADEKLSDVAKDTIKSGGGTSVERRASENVERLNVERRTSERLNVERLNV